MAEGGVVSIVLEGLTDFIDQHDNELGGIRRDVVFASNFLRSIQAFPNDPDARLLVDDDNEEVGTSVVAALDAAYDLQNVVERFALVARRRSGLKIVLKLFRCIFKGVGRHKIGSQIRIITRLGQLRSVPETHNIDETMQSGGVTLAEIQQGHFIVKVAAVEMLAEELVRGVNRVVAIWGLAGIGKTTIAEQVWHHEAVKRHFDCFAWAFVSIEINQVRDVWEAILSSLISANGEQRKEFAKLKDDEIARRLYTTQQEKRCLVVIDDIWSCAAWDSLKAVFPYEETESKILLTTRKREVAFHADRNGFPYEVRPLSIEEAMKLFKQTTYRRDAYRGDFVGLEDDVSMLATELVNERNGHRVVSICGNGGVGKTTIAKLVYHHNIVIRHYDCFAWVHISHQFDERDVWQKILISLISATGEQREELAIMKKDEIAKRLNTIQKEKRCLVVLDDIRTREGWDSLKAGFSYEETKSQILLTTRNKEVALYADSNALVHEARMLNDEESWQLFEKIAIFGQDDSIDTTTYVKKKELGTEMLKCCGGLPLAIIVLAGLLARKNTNEWEIVSKKVDAYLSGDRHPEIRYEGTAWVLLLSYDNLPERLKLCFQYLGHFPENYEIPVKRLTQLWMGEGLITQTSSRSAESMEDASYNCLNELVERRMVQVVKQGLTGNIKTCGLHDVMWDLCLFKAKQENFLYVLNASAATEIPFNKVRRLAIHLDRVGDKLSPTTDKIHSHLRSLLYFVGHFYSERNRKLLWSVLKDLRFLRVLKFEDIKADPEVELPSIIGNLVHLRFLSLKNSEIKQFPSSVANLVCLQTLDLRFVEWVCVKIPNVFGKMEHLRHLYLPFNHRVTEKLSLNTLHNLQTLVNLSSQDCDLKDLIQLTKLKKLVIDAPRSIDLKVLESTTFDHLQSLSLSMGKGNGGDIPTHMVLSCPHLYKLQLHGRIKEFPEGYLCSNLIKITLEETHLEDHQTQKLEKLPRLKMLYLRMGAFKSKTIVFSPGGFPQLEFLSLLGLYELKEWKVERGAMRSLCSLHIGYCWGLEEIPDGLQYISTLKELTIRRMSREFCDRLMEDGDDYDKIRHVPAPSVTITNIR